MAAFLKSPSYHHIPKNVFHNEVVYQEKLPFNRSNTIQDLIRAAARWIFSILQGILGIRFHTVYNVAFDKIAGSNGYEIELF